MEPKVLRFSKVFRITVVLPSIVSAKPDSNLLFSSRDNGSTHPTRPLPSQFGKFLCFFVRIGHTREERDPSV
ncbi:hypothetical protein RRG08_055820 [Elysia crispata]|uniref:Uncharacterized protein n=1 Tax=Elysia crispata TaxID=231223 RepID=A0AAE1E5Z6_9GAST|nr:hypothetical protein RRG08_055820 [Elysia crispata]